MGHFYSLVDFMSPLNNILYLHKMLWFPCIYVPHLTQIHNELVPNNNNNNKKTLFKTLDVQIPMSPIIFSQLHFEINVT